jgi:uncharacterized membrane protein
MHKMANSLNRFSDLFQRHWLAVIVGFLIVYSTLPVFAALFKSIGAESAAQVIYQPYKAMCHTYGFRSFYLFGEQLVYDRDEFEQKTGIDTSTPNGLFAARDYQGDARVGYKIGLCQRDMSIYPAIAINGMIYSFARRRVKQLSWLAFILIGVLPIGLDGFSQLFSQPPFNFIPPFSWLPYRESVWWMRVLTGALFGTSVAWLVFPMIEASVNSSRRYEKAQQQF